MNQTELKSIIEALLFATQDPLSTTQLKKLLKIEEPVLDSSLPQEPDGEEPRADLTHDTENSGESSSNHVESATLLEEKSPDSNTGDLESTQDKNLEENLQNDLEATSSLPADAEGKVALDDPMSQLLALRQEMDSEVSAQDIRQILKELDEEYNHNPARGFELFKVGDGYLLRSKLALAPYLRNLQKMPKPRLSAPAMETLSVIAYQQPVTRARVDEIRGVDSGGVVKTLLDRELIRIVGKSEEPGRPILYGTTLNFLESFNLGSLSDMPTLRDLELLDEQVMPSSISAEQAEVEERDVFSMEDPAPMTYEVLDDSEALVEDLENSLEAIKDLEKKIFAPEQAETQTTDTQGSHNTEQEKS